MTQEIKRQKRLYEPLPKVNELWFFLCQLQNTISSKMILLESLEWLQTEFDFINEVPIGDGIINNEITMVQEDWKHRYISKLVEVERDLNMLKLFEKNFTNEHWGKHKGLCWKMINEENYKTKKEFETLRQDYKHWSIEVRSTLTGLFNTNKIIRNGLKENKDLKEITEDLKGYIKESEAIIKKEK